MTSIYYRRNKQHDDGVPSIFEEKYDGTAEDATYDIMQAWKDGVFLVFDTEEKIHLIPASEVAIIIIRGGVPDKYTPQSKISAVVDELEYTEFWEAKTLRMETALSIQAKWKSGLMMFRGLNEGAIVCIPTSRIKYLCVERKQ